MQDPAVPIGVRSSYAAPARCPDFLAAPPPNSRPSRSQSFWSPSEKRSFSAHRTAQPSLGWRQ